MKLFGRSNRDPKLPDVDLAERLEGVTLNPSQGPAAPAGEEAGPLAHVAPDEPSIAPAAPSTALFASPDPPVPPPDPFVDQLTDLLGPEAFERLLASESARSRRYRRPAALVIAGLAGLDDLARSWGVDVATQAVVSLGGMLRSHSRSSDHVGRIATSQFGVILTETDEIAAINYVERVREAWDAQPAIAAGTLRVGFGWGGTPSRPTLLDARSSAERVLLDELRDRPA